MKLFPEQNGILLNSLQSHHLPSLSQHQSQVSTISMPPTAHHNNIPRSLAGKVISSSNSSSYPMDCDPAPFSTTNSRYSSNGSNTSHPHNHRSNHYTNIQPQNYPLGGSGGHSNSSSSSSRTGSGFHAAPSSLPIDFGQAMFGSSAGMDSSESAYQRHLLGGGSASNIPQQLGTANAKSTGSGGMVNATASRSNGGGNDRDDESRMVGVCVQQSPVVIH